MAALIVRTFGWDTVSPNRALPFNDLGGVDPELQRAVAILASKGIINGYGDGTFGPTDRVLHIQVISSITRSMVQAGYWQAVTQDNPTLYPNVPLGSGHRPDLLTYTKYAGAIPDRPSGSGSRQHMGWGGADLDWSAPPRRRSRRRRPRRRSVGLRRFRNCWRIRYGNAAGEMRALGGESWWAAESGRLRNTVNAAPAVRRFVMLSPQPVPPVPA